MFVDIYMAGGPARHQPTSQPTNPAAWRPGGYLTRADIYLEGQGSIQYQGRYPSGVYVVVIVVILIIIIIIAWP